MPEQAATIITEQTVTLVAAGIAAAAAIIAAVCSIYSAYYQSSKVSKLKLAEFRREWIEVIRIKIAEFLALHYTKDQLVKAIAIEKDKVLKEEMQKKKIELTGELGVRFSHVRLCLNPDEKPHEELLNLMFFMVNKTRKEVDEKRDEFGYSLPDKAREVFKNEWTRLKKEM